MSLEIVYFSGGPRERVLDAILKAGHSVSHVVVNDPARWPKVEATINLARKHALPVTVIGAKSELPKLTELVRGRICFSAGFNYIFPKEIISIANCFLNVHGSLLPKYPGMTVPWAIENGDNQSGVTIHFIDEGVDTGDIILQKSFPLSKFETTRSMMRKMLELEPSVVVEALALYDETRGAGRTPQTSAEAALPRRRPHHSEVDPTKPLLDLIDKIRAADPDHYPAHFFLHGEKVCIRLWRPDKPADEADLI
jgi:methionyl-tRNA formyltransferase